MSAHHQSLTSSSLASQLQVQADTISQHCRIPMVQRLYLPTRQAPCPPEQYCDEFGFVMLDSGAVGAFYVSLDDTLAQLWQRFPEPAAVQLPLDSLLAGLGSDNLAASALGIGAYNALSQHVLQASAYQPEQRQRNTDLRTDSAQQVGMVGYFGRLVDRLVAQGSEVVVLEKIPQRLKSHPQIHYAAHPAELAGCEHIICTAATLINQSLEAILQACRGAKHFGLIGPTAAGLPDSVFARGVTYIGASRFPDSAPLITALDNGENWGKIGVKYEISRDNYPGMAALLAKLADPDHN